MLPPGCPKAADFTRLTIRHHAEYGGMQVAVGNVKLNDGVWDVLFSVVVNNMVRGAYGAALLMAEYYDHLKSNPAALAIATLADSAPTMPPHGSAGRRAGKSAYRSAGRSTSVRA